MIDYFKTLTPESFTSGWWLTMRRTLMLLILAGVVTILGLLFGFDFFTMLIVLASAMPSLAGTLLFFAGFLIYLIGFKRNITLISVITGWLSEACFLFLLFNPDLGHQIMLSETQFAPIRGLQIIIILMMAAILGIYGFSQWLKHQQKHHLQEYYREYQRPKH